MRFHFTTLIKIALLLVLKIVSSNSSDSLNFSVNTFSSSNAELTWREALKQYGGQWAWSCYEHGYGISTKCCCKTICSWNKQKQLLVRHNETVYTPFGASFSNNCSYKGPVKWKKCYLKHFSC